MLIYNPSAWAVAKRRTRHRQGLLDLPCPAGPNGRYIPYVCVFYGIRKFAKNKTAAKELAQHLMEREQVSESHCLRGLQPAATGKHVELQDLGGGRTAKSTVYNYPIRVAQLNRAWQPILRRRISRCRSFNRAIIPSMWARLLDGQPINQVIAWAKDELQGFIR